MPFISRLGQAIANLERLESYAFQRTSEIEHARNKVITLATALDAAVLSFMEELVEYWESPEVKCFGVNLPRATADLFAVQGIELPESVVVVDEEDEDGDGG